MARKNSNTQLRYKITQKLEIKKLIKLNFQGNQRKATRLSIFNLRFQLKKQNKSNVNKYSKQCTNIQQFPDSDLLSTKNNCQLEENLRC